MDAFVAAHPGPLPEPLVWACFAQAASALYFVHTRNVLHRDLKLENLLYTSPSSPAAPPLVKLADFGVARFFGGDTATTCVGTAFNLSPEMISGEPYGPASDVWALGCVLYELMVREKPFGGPNLGAVVKRIMSGVPVQPPPARLLGAHARPPRLLVVLIPSGPALHGGRCGSAPRACRARSRGRGRAARGAPAKAHHQRLPPAHWPLPHRFLGGGGRRRLGHAAACCRRGAAPRRGRRRRCATAAADPTARAAKARRILCARPARRAFAALATAAAAVAALRGRCARHGAGGSFPSGHGAGAGGQLLWRVWRQL